MDYEFRIKQAELDLAHLKDLQQLQRLHLDTNDSRLEALETIIERTTANVERTSANLDILTVQQGKLEAKIDQLVDALLRGQARNGGAGGKA
jgi:hypothetical protein